MGPGAVNAHVHAATLLKISSSPTFTWRAKAAAEEAKIVVPEKETAYPGPGVLGTLPTYGFYLRHVNRMAMSHAKIRPIAPDDLPAIYTDEVRRADFYAITAPTNPAAFSLNNTTDACILLSRAAPDRTIA